MKTTKPKRPKVVAWAVISDGGSLAFFKAGAKPGRDNAFQRVVRLVEHNPAEQRGLRRIQALMMASPGSVHRLEVLAIVGDLLKQRSGRK